MPDRPHARHLEFIRTPHAAAFIARALQPRRRLVEGEIGQTPTARWRMSAPWSAVAAPARTSVLDGWRLPEIIVTQIVGFRLALALLSHPASGMNVWRTVQVRTHLRQVVPMRDTLSVEMHASLSEAEVVARGRERVLRLEAVQAGGAAWESETAFLERAPEVSRGVAVKPLPPPDVRSDILATIQVPPEVRWRWARLSGDYNPIHLNDWYARRLGYRQAFSQPLLVAGAALCQSRDFRTHEMSDVRVWFRGPVFYERPVHVLGERTARGTLLGLRVGDDERLAVVAQATDR